MLRCFARGKRDERDKRDASQVSRRVSRWKGGATLKVGRPFESSGSSSWPRDPWMYSEGNLLTEEKATTAECRKKANAAVRLDRALAVSVDVDEPGLPAISGNQHVVHVVEVERLPTFSKKNDYKVTTSRLPRIQKHLHPHKRQISETIQKAHLESIGDDCADLLKMRKIAEIPRRGTRSTFTLIKENLDCMSLMRQCSSK